MSDIDNPAKRLDNLLRRARSSKYQKVGTTWLYAFEISENPSNDPSREEIKELVSCIYELYKLVDEYKTAIENAPGVNHVRLLAKFDNIENALPDILRLQSSFEQQKNYLTEGLFITLGFCIDELDRNLTTKVIGQKELEEILKKVNRLYEEIGKEKIDGDLKELLLELLETLRRAIHEYRIRGINRLKEGVAKTAVLLGMNSKNSQENTILEKAKMVWTATASLVSFAANLAQIADGSNKFLGNGK